MQRKLTLKSKIIIGKELFSVPFTVLNYTSI